MLVTQRNVQSGYYPEQRLSEDGPYRSGRKKIEAPATKTRYWGNVTFYALLACLLMVSVGMISQYSRVVTVKYQIEQVNREIEMLQSEREHLRIEVKRLSSLERIEAIAINDLGLQYPEKRQWLRIARGD